MIEEFDLVYTYPKQFEIPREKEGFFLFKIAYETLLVLEVTSNESDNKKHLISIYDEAA